VVCTASEHGRRALVGNAGAPWQDARAVDQFGSTTRNTDEGEAGHCAGKVLVPILLVVHKVLEGVGRLAAVGEGQIALEHERSSLMDSLAVELDIPDARSFVEGLTGAGWVDELLLGNRVGTDEGDEVVDAQAVACEEWDGLVNTVEGRWQDALWVRCVAVGAANEDLNCGAERADNGGSGTTHLNEISSANLALESL